MIIAHDLRMIFIKTRKVGGTSFEIALSKYCSPECIVTEISEEDEQTRRELGFTGAQNFTKRQRLGYSDPRSPNYRLSGDFSNHDAASHVRKCLGTKRYEQYLKITIQRDPLDFLVSQYFYRFRNEVPEKVPPFDLWVSRNQKNVLENYRIAPQSGPDACDHVIRYESLMEDLSAISGLPDGFIDLFSSLRAKGGCRPEAARDPVAFFESHGVDHSRIQELLDAQIRGRRRSLWHIPHFLRQKT